MKRSFMKRAAAILAAVVITGTSLDIPVSGSSALAAGTGIVSEPAGDTASAQEERASQEAVRAESASPEAASDTRVADTAEDGAGRDPQITGNDSVQELSGDSPAVPGRSSRRRSLLRRSSPKKSSPRRKSSLRKNSSKRKSLPRRLSSRRRRRRALR